MLALIAPKTINPKIILSLINVLVLIKYSSNDQFEFDSMPADLNKNKTRIPVEIIGITRKIGNTPVVGNTSVYATYKESSRNPSVAELGCADPEAPCRLPNSFQADPPLDQVKNRSFEFGARGEKGGLNLFGMDHNINWNATAFAGRNYNDIIFIGGNRVGTGYFRNVGNTQRMGTEVALNGKLGEKWSWYGNYSYIRASFETHQKIASAGHREALLIPCSGSDEYGANAAGDTAAELDQENCEARESYQLEVELSHRHQ